MPIYEYGCESCGHVMEVLQKVSDPAPKQCDQCHASSPKKLVSKSSFVLKGGGWYITDYARKGKNEGKKDKDSGAGEKKSEGKSEKSGAKKSKSAAKSSKD